MLTPQSITQIITAMEARQLFVNFRNKYKGQVFAKRGGFISKPIIHQLSRNLSTGIRAHLCCDGEGNQRRLFLALQEGVYAERPNGNRPVNDTPAVGDLFIPQELYPDVPAAWNQAMEALNPEGKENAFLGVSGDQIKTRLETLFGEDPTGPFRPKGAVFGELSNVSAWKENFKREMNGSVDCVTYTNLDASDLIAICNHLGGLHISGMWYYFGYESRHESDGSFQNPVRVVTGPVDIYGNLLFRAPAPVAERTYP
ncbi:MAG: hypothetical protein ACK500_10375 [Flavobacteriales bacterium]